MSHREVLGRRKDGGRSPCPRPGNALSSGSYWNSGWAATGFEEELFLDFHLNFSTISLKISKMT